MKRSLFAPAAFVAAALVCSSAWADVTLPAIFSSHMVLQRDLANPVWGKAAPGEEVTVTIADQTHTAKAGDDGLWKVKLNPLAVNAKPQQLTIKGAGAPIVLDDVLVGEVWICSGQSNMQWSVDQANNPDLEKLTANFPLIRLISVPQVGTQEPQFTFQGQWEVCTPQNVGQFSAVGFFFGRQLFQTLNVPIGLIDDAWGGSACEAWINRESLAKDGRFSELLARWENIEKSYDKAKADEAYAAAMEKYKQIAADAKAKGVQPPRPPQHPGGMMTGNARPANIYNGVLKPTIGYGIRGAIWYQGESNAGRAYQYRDLFPFMIKTWRDEWGQSDFSFYWVQLADFMAEQAQPVESAWAELREAQTMTLNLPKTGEAVIIDVGEGNDIHPRNKQEVAMRLARWALANDYGVKIPFQSPTYKSMEVQGDKVVVTFDHVGSGLRTIDVSEVRGFAVAGEDKKWHWATAKVTGNNTVTVSCPEVKNPVAVRYAWADNPVCNLLSKDGLPATPFRSDDWPGVTISAK